MEEIKIIDGKVAILKDKQTYVDEKILETNSLISEVNCKIDIIKKNIVEITNLSDEQPE